MPKPSRIANAEEAELRRKEYKPNNHLKEDILLACLVILVIILLVLGDI